MRKIINNEEYLPLRGELEILRYNSDKTKLLHEPYVDKNVIVNVGRQLIRGLLGNFGAWTNNPTIATSWGDKEPLSIADIRVSKMKLGMQPIAATPSDETLMNPMTDGTTYLENPAGYVGDGVVMAFAGVNLANTPVVRRSVVVNTWVDVGAAVTSYYITAVDDGNGVITGQRNVYDAGGWVTITVTGTINYGTGAITVTYSHPPTTGVTIDVFYTTDFIDAQVFAAGGTPFNHTLVNVPVSRGSLVIVASGGATATTGVAYDNGDGTITGAFVIDPATPVTVTGEIVYETGVLELNFAPVLPAGVTLTHHYQVDWSRTVDVYFPNAYSIRFEIELGALEFEGQAFAEEGLFSDDTFDLMIARKAFTPFRKGVGEVTVFRHTIII